MSLALAAPARSVALQNEPEGFGGAKFGMSVKTVREAFPDMRPLAEAADSPLQIYAVENQSFAGLRPCTLTLSFLTDKLYETKFDCGRDPSVKAALYKTFGEPSEEQDRLAVWRGERAVVSMNTDVSTFAFANLALKAVLTQYLLQKALTAAPAAAQPAPEAPAPGGAKEKGTGSSP